MTTVEINITLRMFTAKREFLTGPRMNAKEPDCLVVSVGCGMHSRQTPQFIVG